MALQDKLIDALGRFATTFNSYRYIMAIKSAFITLMPVIIVGAFSVLISNMVLDPKNGLAWARQWASSSIPAVRSFTFS